MNFNRVFSAALAIFALAALSSPLPAQEDESIDDIHDSFRNIRTITREEIEKYNAPDLGTLLREVLHISLTKYGPYGSPADINMRGFNSEGIVFLVNGVPVNSAVMGGFDYSQINIDSIDSIEIGDAINIITIRQETRGFRGGASVWNLSALPGNAKNESAHWEDLVDTQRLSLTGGMGTEQLSLSGSVFAGRAGNHFLYDSDNPSGTFRNEDNEVWDVGGAASMTLLFPNLMRLSLAMDIYYGDKKHQEMSTAAMNMNKDMAAFSSQQMIKIDIPELGRSDISSELILNNSQQTLPYALAGDDLFHNEYDITLIDRTDWYMRPDLTLRSQFDYRYISLESANLSSGFRHDIGLALSAEYFPIEDLLIIPSLKGAFVIVADNFFPAPVPKLSLIWRAADSLYIKNNYFRDYKFPDFMDLYWTSSDALGNTKLKPEDSWGGDLGAEYRIGNWAILEGAFFGYWTGDMIRWEPDISGTYRPRNSGEAASFGFDTETRFTFPLSKGPFTAIDLSFSYKFLYSYFLDSDKRLPDMPTHSLGLNVNAPWSTGSVLISGHFEGDRYMDDEQASPFFLLTLGALQRINNHFTAFMTLRNVLNMPNESFKGIPQPGLTVSLGVKMNFEEYY
jgi:vitamin B12 transporter